MKNKLLSLFVLALSVSGSVASAEGITLDTRFDQSSVSYNDDGIAAGNRNNSSFGFNRMRILFSTKVNDQLSAKLRLNLLSASGANTPESGVSKYVDYGFFSHQLNENFYLNAGKVIALIGGREAMVNPGDYYFASTAGAEILGRDTTAIWPVGAIVGYQFDGQKVEFLAANTTTSDKESTTVAPATAASDKSTQTRQLVGLSFLGSFMDKKIQPIFSYHQDAEVENTEKRDYMAIGSKFAFDQFEVDADYLMNSKSFKAWGSGSVGNVTSMVLSLRHKTTDKLNLVAKVDSSTQERATAAGANPTMAKYTITQLGLAAEYAPIADTKFRYHAAVTTSETKPETGSSITEQKIILGARLVCDLMK